MRAAFLVSGYGASWKKKQQPWNEKASLWRSESGINFSGKEKKNNCRTTLWLSLTNPQGENLIFFSFFSFWLKAVPLNPWLSLVYSHKLIELLVWAGVQSTARHGGTGLINSPCRESYIRCDRPTDIICRVSEQYDHMISNTDGGSNVKRGRWVNDTAHVLYWACNRGAGAFRWVHVLQRGKHLDRTQCCFLCMIVLWDNERTCFIFLHKLAGDLSWHRTAYERTRACFG